MDKAQISLDVTRWILKIMFLVAVTVYITFVLFYFFTVRINTETLRTQILLHRFIYSTDGISYFDPEIRRLYPEIVDLNKFKSDTLSRAINSKYAAAKLTLRELSSNQVYKIYYNEPEFRAWLPYTFDIKKYYRYDNQRYVLIKNGSSLVPGNLKIEIITYVG